MMVNDGTTWRKTREQARPTDSSGAVPRHRALALGALFFAAGMVVAAAAGGASTGRSASRD